MSTASSAPSPHNLSPQRRDEIFREQIVPQVLQGGVSQDTPAVVYLMSQPGAGKTSSAAAITHALDQRGGAVRFCSDFFKPYHPEYLHLLEHDPRRAGSLIRADYKEWKARGEEYVRSQGTDAVIEIAPGSLRQFLDSAEKFDREGYQVHVATIALPAAVSRLGTALRFADQLSRDERGARFPTTEGHDQCYRAVAEIAEHISQGQFPVAGSLVVRRGLIPVSAGSSIEETADVLERERSAPLAAPAAEQFRSGVLRLREELGSRWASEIDDIVNRAHGLLPAPMHTELTRSGGAGAEARLAQRLAPHPSPTSGTPAVSDTSARKAERPASQSDLDR